jgi:hypothetical protein
MALEDGQDAHGEKHTTHLRSEQDRARHGWRRHLSCLPLLAFRSCFTTLDTVRHGA